MISGLTLFTLVHVLISFVGIVSGCVVVYGLITAKRLDRWTWLFLASTAATTITGFLFPFNGFTPAVAVGIISLLALIPTFLARYRFSLAGSWRWVYVVGAVFALYLNVFVLVVQAFLKVPALHALAPKGSEPVFAVVQGTVLLAFVVAGTLSVQRFRPVLA